MARQVLRLTLVSTTAAALLSVGADAQFSSRAAFKAIDLSARISAPPTAQIRAVEQRVAAAPATEVATGQAPSDMPPPPPPEPASAPELGKLYHVDLKPAEEAAVANQLASQQSIQALGPALVTLPGAYKVLAVDNTELLLKPFVIPQTVSYDIASGRFVGSIKIGVHEISGPAPSRKLSAPIAFEVLQDELANPPMLDVDHSGFPMSRIRIAADNAPNGVAITVASPFDPQGIPVLLPLAPAFAVMVSKSMQGMGLEETIISVSAKGLDKPQGRKVMLTINGPAHVDDQQLTLDEEGNASTKIRSVGTGSAAVTATLGGFKPVQATIALTMPFLTFSASALGGLMGGLIRLLPGLRRASGRRFLLGLLVALLVGLLVFGLYAVGVNVLPFSPKVQVGAVLVLVVSAMGAYLGSGILGGPPPPPPQGNVNPAPPPPPPPPGNGDDQQPPNP